MLPTLAVTGMLISFSTHSSDRVAVFFSLSVLHMHCNEPTFIRLFCGEDEFILCPFPNDVLCSKRSCVSRDSHIFHIFLRNRDLFFHDAKSCITLDCCIVVSVIQDTSGQQISNPPA